MVAPQQAFDTLAAHEDRLVRLEDAILESAKQTAELSGCMRSFEGKLEIMLGSLGDNLESIGRKMSETEKALAETGKRLEALEAKKEADAKQRAAWAIIAQKVGAYVVTGLLGAVGGWFMKHFIGG